jgi:DNA-binding transcriptional LysR family regulator
LHLTRHRRALFEHGAFSLISSRERHAIDTRQLRIFTAIYKTGSFTKAAEILHTSQPTVSEHLQNLEQSLGCRLFDRLGRGIRATAEADSLYPRALAILEDLDRLKDELATARRRIAGDLRIGASAIPAEYFLPGIAADFHKRHPDVTFEVRVANSATTIQALVAGDVLIGIVGGKFSGRGLVYETFRKSELTLVASSEMGLPDEMSVAELQQTPLLLREEGSAPRKYIAEELAKHRIALDELTIAGVFGSPGAIREAVKAGLGCAMLANYVVMDELNTGRLRQIALPELDLRREFSLVTVGKRSLPHHYKVFLEALRRSA